MRHTYGQAYSRDQLTHADAVRAAREAGRSFHWVPATVVQAEPLLKGYSRVPEWSTYARVAFLPGDLVWTARTGWIGGA